MLRKVSKVKFFGKFEVTWSLLAHIGGSNDGGSDPVVTRESNIYSFDNTRQTHPRARANSTSFYREIALSNGTHRLFLCKCWNVNVIIRMESHHLVCFNCHVQKVQDHKINVCVEIQFWDMYIYQGWRQRKDTPHMKERGVGVGECLAYHYIDISSQHVQLKSNSYQAWDLKWIILDTSFWERSREWMGYQVTSRHSKGP